MANKPEIKLIRSENSNPARRRHERHRVAFRANWDFFTEATGSKRGFIKNISTGGALICTQEPIDHRRWVRMLVKDDQSNLSFAAVGRVIRCEQALEAWGAGSVTNYRFALEFIQPLNPVSLMHLSHTVKFCSYCGVESPSISDAVDSEKSYCVLCHLRLACRNLLSPEG